jgi:plastocyanin
VLTAALVLGAGGTAHAAVSDPGAWSAKPKPKKKAKKPAPPKTWQITQHNLNFDSDVLRIKPGDTVVWTNKETDDTIHSVVQGNGSEINSPDIPPNTHFEWTFTEASEWQIICRFHPDMFMNIEVVGKGGKKSAHTGHTVQPPPPATGTPGEPTIPGTAGVPIAFDPPARR